MTDITGKPVAKIVGVDEYGPMIEWSTHWVDLVGRSLFVSPMNDPKAGAIPTSQDAYAEFKNFHRALCERFGYVHDERDWKRDQLSLIEWVASASDALISSTQSLDRKAGSEG